MPYRLNPVQLIALGAVSIGLGAWQYLQRKRRVKTWIRAAGTVENIRRDPEGNVTVRIAFLDDAGRKQACCVPHSDSNSIGLGTEIAIAYNPHAPSTAVIAEKREMNLAAILFGAIGAALIAAGVIVSQTE